MASQSTSVKLLMKRNSALDLREGIHVEVRVASIVHPRIWKTAEKFIGRHSSTNEMIKIVEALGGVAAGLLCKEYNDPIDPSECGKKAIEAWKRMYKAFETNDVVTLTNGVTIP